MKILTHVVIISCFSTGLLSATELPQIELPEYVISGIERATRIAADRLETGQSTEIIPARFPDLVRPSLMAASAWLPPSRPEFTLTRMADNIKTSVAGGSFGKAGLSINFVRHLSGALLIGDGFIRNHANRIGIGEKWEWRSGGTALIALGKVGVISSRLGFAQNAFDVKVGSDTKTRQWSDFTITVLSNELHTPVGRVAEQIRFDSWQRTGFGDLAGSTYDIHLVHNIPVNTGWLETKVWVAGESIAGDKHQLGLASAQLRYGRRYNSNVHIWLGMLAFAGSSVGGESRGRGVVHLGMDFKPGFDGLFRLFWHPAPVFQPVSHLTNKWKPLHYVSRGAVTEPLGRLSAQYQRDLRKNLDVKLQVNWMSARHVPFPVVDTDQSLIVVTRKLTRYGFGGRMKWSVTPKLSMSIAGERVISSTSGSASGDAAPQQPETRVTFAEELKLFGWDYNLNVEWSDETPINFTGEAKSPDRILMNAAAQKEIVPNSIISIGFENILNVRYWDFPGYDEPPFTVHVMFSHRFEPF